jgi:hypothetical protein
LTAVGLRVPNQSRRSGPSANQVFASFAGQLPVADLHHAVVAANRGDGHQHTVFVFS